MSPLLTNALLYLLQFLTLYDTLLLTASLHALVFAFFLDHSIDTLAVPYSRLISSSICGYNTNHLKPTERSA